MTDKQWENIIALHNTAPFKLVREAAPYFRVTDGEPRCIINISSTSGVHGNAGQANYGLAKSGINGLTKVIAKEWGPKFGVRANSIAFGHILTRLTAAKEAGVKNVIFHDASVDPLPGNASHDFITTFDCLHDMTRPDLVMQAIRKAIKSDGTWLIADIHGQPTFEQNLKDNPLAPLMYGFSVLCCMSSALSEPGGLGLGTLGFPEPVARTMTLEAGFTRFTTRDFENPINAYYEVRP